MEQVGIAGFQKCSEILTWKVALSVEIIVEEHLPESPDVVVALEGQNVAFTFGPQANQAPFELHRQSEPSENFLANSHARDEMLQVHKPTTGLNPLCVVYLCVIGAWRLDP